MVARFDVGTKLYGAAHGIEQPTLYRRINALADASLITRDLADWAHAIRSIRNDALHEADSISRDELVAIRGFSETLLTYLFTLPGMLRDVVPGWQDMRRLPRDILDHLMLRFHKARN